MKIREKSLDRTDSLSALFLHVGSHPKPTEVSTLWEILPESLGVPGVPDSADPVLSRHLVAGITTCNPGPPARLFGKICDGGHGTPKHSGFSQVRQGDDGGAERFDRLGYLISLSQRHFEEIGFIPRPRLESYLVHDQIWFSQENDDPCGFLIFGKGWPILRIYQTCIQYDSRRKYHASNLVLNLIRKALSENYLAVSLWCADDIEANFFWKSSGFQFVEQKKGGMRRGRKINRWVFSLRNLFDRH